MENIQMVDLKSQYLKIEEEIDQSIKSVIEESSFINGPIVREFSKNLSEYLNVKHVIPCGNGTDALQIALMSLNLSPGDEVITTTFTFIATGEVISLLGLKPVFVDVDPNNFNLLPQEVEKAITKKTKVLLPVHLFGQCAPMEELKAIADKHQLYIVEDNAQALGADFIFSDGTKQKAGTIGHFGTTSFFPSKILGAYGDGGAIFTNNDELAEKAKMICNHGSKVKYQHEIIGVNSRLDSIQAAVLNVKLQYLDKYIAHRQEVAKTFNIGLRDVNWLETPKNENYSSHCYHQYTLKIGDGKRDQLKSYLSKNGIPSMVYYPQSLHQQKALRNTQNGNLLYSEELQTKVLSLPIHTELNTTTINFIVEKIKSFK